MDAVEEPFFENFAKACKQERSRELIMYMQVADDYCNLFEQCKVDCLLELMFLVVHPEYCNKKIGEYLTKATIEIATRLLDGENVKVSINDEALCLEPRPKLLAALFTSTISQRLGSKCGFEVAAKINYKDVYYQGQSYASILGNANPDTALMFKRL